MKTFFGGVLLAVGILIAGGSGVCSLYLLFAPGTGLDEGWSNLPLILIYGGLPFALGVAIALGGRSLIRQARGEQAQP